MMMMSVVTQRVVKSQSLLAVLQPDESEVVWPYEKMDLPVPGFSRPQTMIAMLTHLGVREFANEPAASIAPPRSCKIPR